MHVTGSFDAFVAGKLGPAFFLRDAKVVARALVGTYLVHAPGGGARGARAVRIVETEAYCGPKDLACHARAGLTKRTKTLLGPPGRAYVFLIYGMYDCFNVTCRADGSGHAVLVRGGEPVFGIEPAVRCDGPGRLGRAMGITRALDGCDLTGDDALPERATGRARETAHHGHAARRRRLRGRMGGQAVALRRRDEQARVAAEQAAHRSGNES